MVKENEGRSNIGASGESSKILTKPLPQILDEMDANIKAAAEAAAQAQEAARLAKAAAGEATSASIEAAERAEEARKAGEKAAEDATQAAAEAAAKAEDTARAAQKAAEEAAPPVSSTSGPQGKPITKKPQPGGIKGIADRAAENIKKGVFEQSDIEEFVEAASALDKRQLSASDQVRRDKLIKQAAEALSQFGHMRKDLTKTQRKKLKARQLTLMTFLDRVIEGSYEPTQDSEIEAAYKAINVGFMEHQKKYPGVPLGDF